MIDTAKVRATFPMSNTDCGCGPETCLYCAVRHALDEIDRLRAEVAESARELLDLSARHESLLAALGHSESEVARLESIIQRNPDGSIDYARMVSSLQAKNARLVDSLRIECETSSEFLKENVKLRAVRDAANRIVEMTDRKHSFWRAYRAALADAEREGE